MPFATMIVVATISPGPNLLIVLNAMIVRGYAGVRATIAGNLAANSIVTLVAVLGSGALIEAGGEPLRIAYTVAGGCFLLYLGSKALFGAAKSARALQNAARGNAGDGGRGSAFRTAFLTTITNPKVLLFQSVVLPQFLNPERPILPQYAVMMATIVASVTAIHHGYAALAGFALRIFANERRCAFVFQTVSGATFCALGSLTLYSLVR